MSERALRSRTSGDVADSSVVSPVCRGKESGSMEKRLVTRYSMPSAEAADENQRRVEGVFAELAATRPENVSYLVFRLADDSFVHVSFHDHTDDEPNPIASTAAFAHFQDGHADRREGAVDQQRAELLGAPVTGISSRTSSGLARLRSV